eukprot:1203113-Pleurochrysis_carterae.AAC.1
MSSPSFQTPTISNAPTKDIPRTRSRDELANTTDPDAETPITKLPTDPQPKSWYVILGGPFEEVRFGNYDRDIRQDVARYANRRAYGPNA